MLRRDPSMLTLISIALGFLFSPSTNPQCLFKATYIHIIDIDRGLLKRRDDLSGRLAVIEHVDHLIPALAFIFPLFPDLDSAYRVAGRVERGPFLPPRPEDPLIFRPA